MLSGLILTAFVMGVGGMPHCAAMCGAPCAMAFPRGVPWLSLLGRCVGYALLGAVAAGSAGTLAAWGRQIAFLQPLWVLLLAAAVMMGLLLLYSGRMPGRVDDWGQRIYRRARSRWAKPGQGRTVSGEQPWRALLAGVAWIFMPCGLLYAALTVAMLAPFAWGGALVMLAFAVPSALGVWAAPMVLRTLTRGDVGNRSKPTTAAPSAALNVASMGVARQTVPVIWMRQSDGSIVSAAALGAMSGGAPSTAFSVDVQQATPDKFDPGWAVRLSGLMLSGIAGWALYHQLLTQWRAWCA
jgi:sulfite exporter TauE/SafE